MPSMSRIDSKSGAKLQSRYTSPNESADMLDGLTTLAEIVAYFDILRVTKQLNRVIYRYFSMVST